MLWEADDVSTGHDEAASIADRLQRLYSGLSAFLATGSAPAARERMRDRACQTLQELIAKPGRTAEVAQFLGKIARGLAYWLTFVTQQ